MGGGRWKKERKATEFRMYNEKLKKKALQNSCINKSRTKAISTNILIRKKRNFTGLHSKEKTTGTNDCWEKANQHLPGMSPFIGCPIQSSHP